MKIPCPGRGAARLSCWLVGIVWGVARLAAADDAFFEPTPFVQATAAFEQGDLERAEALAVPLAEGETATAEACALLGQIRLQQKRPAEAVALLGRAVEKNPTSAAWRSRWGDALVTLAEAADGPERVAQLARARAELERAAAVDPNCVEAQFGLLRVHLLDPATATATEADRYATRTVELDPLSFAYDVAVVAEQHGRFDLAEQYYALTDHQFPGNPWLELKHAAMLVRLGRVAEARAQLEVTLQRVPGFKPAVELLGSLPPA